MHCFSRQLARSESGYQPADQWIKQGELRIEYSVSQPSGSEGFVPQAQREQYRAQADHGYAPDEADRDYMIGSEDQAAH